VKFLKLKKKQNQSQVSFRNDFQGKMNFKGTSGLFDWNKPDDWQW